jgi:hypothetical protein
MTYNLKYSNIQTKNDIVVYVNNIAQSSDYTVNYQNGIITFNSQLQSSDVVKADYWYCPINIYDEGKNPASDDFKYPAVAVYEDIANHEAYELGSSKTEKVTTWVFEVWSERGGERSDMTDTIVELLEGNIPIVDYNSGFPLDRNGNKNESFDATNILTYAVCDSINYTKGGSLDIGDKPKYLSQIYAVLRVSPL